MTATQTLVRRDRWADWAVIILVTLALILGLALREVVLSNTVPFTTESGISGKYPADWIRETATADPSLSVRNPRGGEFDTVLELYNRSLAHEAQTTLALDTLKLERTGQMAVYKDMGIEQVTIDGKTATQRTFTYIHVDDNPYLDQLPVVVQGIDLALRDGDRVVIVTFLANAEDFEINYRYFRAFTESLRW